MENLDFPCDRISEDEEREFPFLDLQIPLFPLWRNALPKFSLLISCSCLSFLFIILATSNAFKYFFFILLLTLLYNSFLIFPFLEKAKSLQKWIKRKQDCICQACTVTRSLHHDALTASYSCALALLFPIRASGCCTNQILLEISEGFFFSSATQVPGQRANTVLFYWHRPGLMPGN